MYRNKRRKSTKTENAAKKRALNTIDENATMKIPQGRKEATNEEEKRSIFDIGNLEEPQSSEENIPASQEYSQRYLSQRSNALASTLGRTQSWNNSSRPPNTYFELILTKAGVQMDGEYFTLACDHISFVHKFRDLLKNSNNYPENIETFKAGLSGALDSKSNLALKLLTGCSINIPDDGISYQSQNTMIMNFLTVDFLCEPVISVLLDKIEAAATGRSANNSQTGLPILPLMLAQLCYVLFSHGDMIFERIKTIFEKANEAGKRDIIANADLILESNKHDEFADILLKNMRSSNEFFSSNVITALTKLFLCVKMQEKLRFKIMTFIESKECPNDLLPTLTNLILNIISEDEEVHLPALVGALRKILIHHSTRSDTTEQAEKQIQLKIFDSIDMALSRCRQFFTAWQKYVIAIPENQFRSIDFIMLLALLRIREENSLYIENVLRRRIKNEELSMNLLNDAKKNFAPLLEKYAELFIDILHDFLKEKHETVVNFARSSFSILFDCECVQKNIINKLLQLTCENTVHSMATTALELLRDLHRKHRQEIQNLSILMMPLLDRLNESSLSQTRLIMELLSSMAYPPPEMEECPNLQEQIDMVVKKQIISRNEFTQKQGIIGCAQLIVSIARSEDAPTDNDDHNSTYSTIDELPEGRGKTAARLFERMQSATMSSSDTLGLFYDELASICVADANEQGNFSKAFLVWLTEHLTQHFQTRFMTDSNTFEVGGISFSGLKCINLPEDVCSELTDSNLDVAVKISDLVLNPPSDTSSSISVLAPTFNLLSVLHFQRDDGSLEAINALLGCAISLPTFFDNETECIKLFQTNIDEDSDIKKQLLDIYFYCANWMREIIPSFITQRDVGTKKKVLRRLTDLIKIEEKIRKILQYAGSEYIAPKSQFFLTDPIPAEISVPKTKKSKGSQSAADVNTEPSESEMTLLNQLEASIAATPMEKTIQIATGGKSCTDKLNFQKWYSSREMYRQLNSNVMLLMCEDLTIEMPFPSEKVGLKIGLQELHFVLRDLVYKLESITGVKEFHSAENLQYLNKPHFFINDLSGFFPNICANMEKLSLAIKEALEKVNGVYSNVDLFTNWSCYLRVCFCLSLRLFAAFFSWPEFLEGSGKDLLKKSIISLLKPSKKEELQKQDLSSLIPKIFNKFLNYEPEVLDLQTSLHLKKLVITFRKIGVLNNVDSDVIRKQGQDIGNLCKNLLQRKWYNYNGHQEKGARCNICLDEIVKEYLKNCDFKRLRNIITVIQQEISSLKGKDGFMKSFPCFQRINFPILFRGLCGTLIYALNDIVIQRTTLSGDNLRPWESSCEMFKLLLEIMQSLDSPRNFQIFVKYAHMYIKLVFQRAIPHLEEFFQKDSVRVVTFLQTLQDTTRFLHKLCCQSKALKNAGVVSQIPGLRETMENFVFRIKALLAANKCSTAFRFGDLKNRDIHGQDLISQSTIDSPEDSEDEIPEDDETVCESLLEDNELESHQHINVCAIIRGGSKSSTRSDCY